jgi:hypothetical protein
VSVFSPAGDETVVWEGSDPTPTGSGKGVSKIPVANVSFPTGRVKIYLDSPAVSGWNEIDAVALVDRASQAQWASSAQASSTFATGPITTGRPEDLIPPWCSLARVKLDSTTRPANPPDRLAAAFGWPWLAMSGERTLTAGTQSQPWGYRPRGFTMPMGNLNQPPLLPYRPIWSGFLLDTILFGVVLWVASWVLTRPLTVLKVVRRLRRGQCLQCGYNLLYDFARGCPECGWLRDLYGNSRESETKSLDQVRPNGPT